MGNTYEVEVWRYSDIVDGYRNEQFWRGESFIAALWNLWKAKREGYGCVRLAWR